MRHGFYKGVKKVSRSFSLDLKSYTLDVPLGAEPTVLNRTVTTLDLHAMLVDEGFNSFEVPRGYHRLWGNDINALRDQVASKLLGVPRDAVVCIKTFGKLRQQVLVTLKY
jgi:hypothetical protein